MKKKGGRSFRRDPRESTQPQKFSVRGRKKGGVKVIRTRRGRRGSETGRKNILATAGKRVRRAKNRFRSNTRKRGRFVLSNTVKENRTVFYLSDGEKGGKRINNHTEGEGKGKVRRPSLSSPERKRIAVPRKRKLPLTASLVGQEVVDMAEHEKKKEKVDFRCFLRGRRSL